MRIAYLDCFSGMSGDMFLGALVDAGVSAALLEQTVAALDIGQPVGHGRIVEGHDVVPNARNHLTRAS